MLFSSFCLGLEVQPTGKQIINQFDVFIDHSHQHDAQTIQAVEPRDWQPMKQAGINLGYTDATVWLTFTLSHSQPSSIHRMLDITYPLLDFVTLYEVPKDGAAHIIMRSGDRLPFWQRNFSHPTFVNIVELNPGQRHNYLLKIRSHSPIQTELILWTPEAFHKHYRQQTSIVFFYLGLILSSAAFNFLVFLYLREKVYLVYSVYAASFALLMATQQALLYEYVFPLSPNLHHWSQLILANSTISLTILFNLFYLKLKVFSKSGWMLFGLMSFPALLLLFSTGMGYSMAIKITVYSALFIIPVCFVIGMFNVKKDTDGKLYLAAWSCLFAGAIVFLMSKVGILEFNQFTKSSILIGSALELLIFSAALARRIHSEKTSRIQAQQIIIDNGKKNAELQEDIIYNTTHHDITGLPNRNFLEQWLDIFLKESHDVTLVLFHFSRMQEIDKTLGRDVSNETLETFGMRLNSEAQALNGIEAIEPKENFYVATLSATTHALIINNKADKPLLTQLKDIHKTINHTLIIGNMEIDPYVHCAYASYPEHGQQAHILLRHAGIALDAASKSENHIVRYTREINPYNERRIKLMAELKRAIVHNTLELHYQPLVDTYTGQFIGAEALIRWPHEEYGLIMPDEFIHIAEKTGVIQALSLWVIRRAVENLKDWKEINPEFLLSVNISAVNLQDNKFIAALHILLKDDVTLAKNMILEVTESQIMTDTPHALKNLWDLSELGFQIAIDDFGTGYSNLAYLKKLPANELKIDKAFILNLESDSLNQTLVQTAIQMAHNLGLKVVAEGVESERTRILLGQMGCDYCQGFHFGRAVPVQQFNKLYADNRKCS